MYENHYASSKARVITIDCGKVEVGKVAVKKIEICNESCKEQIYEAQRDPITNPLDHVFHLRSYNWVLAPQETFICEIRYRPFVAFSTNVDYFTIVDSSGGCLKLVARGCSFGPEVTCSATKLFLLCGNEIREAKKRIKLTNSSKTTAIFMFDIDERHRPFKLDATHGSIDPRSQKYVTISFDPPENGKYTCHLVCLVLHQEPIIIELYGYCGSSFKKVDTSCFRYHWKVKKGFDGYLTDVANTVGDLPPVSLSRNYFNFAQADVNTESIVQRISQPVCLTNHTRSTVSVRWEKDDSEIFNVTPRTTKIRANQSALFEISFNPDARSNLFARELIGSVFLESQSQNESFVFPFVASVRGIGHSFPVASNGWIPQYEIPQTVIMPSCVPPFPVCTTFLIKKFGHLPLLFHFVPPSESRFVVKPMMGLIHQDFQIIALEMLPKPENEQIYVERWVVYFNGNTKNESYIYFKGYAEYASVSFNKNNVVTFATAHPRCQQFERIIMRNTTRHAIKYEFFELPDELNVERLTGEISSNEIVHHDWSLCLNECLDYDFEIRCLLSAVKNGIRIGPKACATAVPSELSFGVQQYSETKSMIFHVFNFSSVNIYYKIVCGHSNWPIGNLEDVEVRPGSGTVFSGAHERITVTVTPRIPGYYEFVITYLVRVYSTTDTLISWQVPRNICEVKCMCVLPTLKVKNLCTYGSYTDMGKPFLWNLLQINELNEILKKILPGEKETLSIAFPPMIVNDGTRFVHLTITNPTSISISWTLKRIYRCSCKPVVKKRSISFDYKEFVCVHDELCTVLPTSGTLKPKAEMAIAINFRYTLVGKSEINWDFNLSHDRHVFLNIAIEGLSGSERELHFLSGPRLKFGRVHLGNKNPTYQTHWISNPTNSALPYSVDTSPLCKFNEAYCCEIFSCATQSGIVEAGSSEPIIFTFRPRTFGTCEVAVPVTLGDKKAELVLEGQSTCDDKSKISGETIPARCTSNVEEFPVHFSTDCISLRTMSTHERVVKMIFLHNNFTHDPLSFEWERREVPGILHVEIYPRKGIIQQMKVQSFHVQICSKGCPCNIDVNVSCKLFNATERREYQRSLLKFDILRQELEGQFTITEKGTEVPKPRETVFKEPEIFYKTLTVRCYIHGPEDEQLNLSCAQELKRAPPNAIRLEKGEKKISLRLGKELDMSLFVLEGLLWDILDSREFKTTIRETLTTPTELYYSQFTMSLPERNKLVERSYISPPWTIIDTILEKMLFNIMHEEYNLDTIHLIPSQDVRHANYLKMISTRDRITIPEDPEKFRFGRNQVRIESAVSFAD